MEFVVTKDKTPVSACITISTAMSSQDQAEHAEPRREIHSKYLQSGCTLQAIRAGSINIDRDEPYRFALPPSWKEGKVANIQSGNFCQVRRGGVPFAQLLHEGNGSNMSRALCMQPRCDEPWTEVVFENSADGKATVQAPHLLSEHQRARLPVCGHMHACDCSHPCLSD